uniref:Polyketide synthase n=14 Tax=Cylindrospermopsis raciborskii TaxID=77022 RepID=X2KX30_9CYAN|nr:polyketide synthase [Cylindrospermopsis raciborskii CHAB358]
MSQPNYGILMKNALNEINSLRSQLAAVEAQKNESIAIVGMSCRFPGGATTPERFWVLLREGISAITEIPADRWDVDKYYDADPTSSGKIHTRYGGFLNEVDTFEPSFFNIAAREAVSMDPQQRLLLEVSWEALESGNIVPATLFDSSTGVFIGIGGSNYKSLMIENRSRIGKTDLYELSGTDVSVAAGRISYVLGLMGPSFVIDTACSSSLVSVHQACQSLRQRECDLALAGGVGLLIDPDEMIGLSQGGMLAPDGSCKTFDANANGYVRGEGCGMIVLKRLSDATADGDNILAIIRGSMVNHDGHSSGLTAPRGPAQVSVIKQALDRAGIAPDAVSYVEAHGTGTPLGDPIEMDSLNEVFGRRTEPLWVGSVKTNIGHLEAASGIAGLIKVVLMLKNKQIPPHLHFKTPNPYIDWKNLPVEIPTTLHAWDDKTLKDRKRIAGVSSFSFSGTNAHIVLSEAPSSELISNHAAVERPWHLLTLSAKNEEALANLVGLYQSFISTTDASLADICYTANTARTHFSHRLALSATSHIQIEALLAAYKEGSVSLSINQGCVLSNSRAPKVAFLFTGQGSQYVQMAGELYETQPTFRNCLDRCAEILQSIFSSRNSPWGNPLLSVLYPNHESKEIDQTAYTQPALFAVEYALAQMWRSWGIEPDIVMGHSIGEYVAACVAGIFSLEDGLKLAAERGRLMQALPQDGEMVAISASLEEVKPAIQSDQRVVIAAVNGPRSVVISGDRQAVQVFTNTLEDQGIRCKRLSVSHAFHSPLMKPMEQEFAQVAREINYSPPKIALVSNLTGDLISPESSLEEGVIASPGYWVNHLCNPVLFADGIATMQAQDVQVFLEVGPKPTLSGLVQQYFDEVAHSDRPVTIPTLRPKQPNWQTLLESLGQLYALGVQVNWAGFDRDYARRKVSLPTYAWKRQRYWLEKQSAPLLETTQVRPATAIVEHLEQGNVPKIVDLLAATDVLSGEARKLLPSIIELLVAKHREEATQKPICDWLYEVVWQPQLLTLSTLPAVETEGRQWLIFADASGHGEALAAQLRQQGDIITLVYAGLKYHSANNKQNTGGDIPYFQIDPIQREDYERLFAALPPLYGIVHLWSLDILSLDKVSNLIENVQLGSGTLLNLIQTVLQLETPTPSLWLVTKNAQAVRKNDSLVGVLQSPLWGMGKVIALEHPELNCVSIDLDGEGLPDEQAKFLAAELRAASEFRHTTIPHESQVAWRNRTRYVSRFKGYQKHPATSSKMPIRPDATYLITGGFGGLGLLVARWMVEQGATHLFLMGRSQPKPAAQKQLQEIAALGATVTVVQADVGIRSQVADVLAQIDKAYPLAGIIHTAGVLDDGILLQQNWARFSKVFAPKLEGAWHLHTLTEEMPLDFFICFSSTAGLLGSGGQANYAAANAFLDAFAHHRRIQGLPALSINWDAWSQVGMAVRLQQASSQSTTVGQDSSTLEISPEQGLQIFAYLLQQPSAQIAAISTDGLRKMYDTSSAFFALLDLDRSSSTTQEQSTLPHEVGLTLLEQLQQARPKEREKMLLRHLQTQVAAVLRSPELPAVHQPFTDLGMDSLMSLELRRRLEESLGIQMPATLAFDYPMVDRLAKFILTQICINSEPDTSAVLTPDGNGEEKDSNKDRSTSTSVYSNITSMAEDLFALESLLNKIKRDQ